MSPLKLFSMFAFRKVGQASRILPQKPWAGAVPTLLSHEALDSLCTPSAHPQGLPGPELCPLERFLGCVSLRRQLQRNVQSEEGIVSCDRWFINSCFDNEIICTFYSYCFVICLKFKPTQNTEPGMLNFKVNSLQCHVYMNQHHFQSLHIKISTSPENKEPWSLEDLQVRYFVVS